MKRIIAIDYGDVRTGFAVSDMTQSIISDAFIINENNAVRLSDIIKTEADTRGADTIVLGYPKNMDGTLGPRAEKSKALADLLEERGLNVVLWDERRTTIAAQDILHTLGVSGKSGAKKRKNTVDAIAAGLILEAYLRREQNKS